MATILGLLSRWSWLCVIAENRDGTMESFFSLLLRKTNTCNLGQHYNQQRQRGFI
jgi:hypothetical protein